LYFPRFFLNPYKQKKKKKKKKQLISC
jgi:hypothetical protein